MTQTDSQASALARLEVAVQTRDGLQARKIQLTEELSELQLKKASRQNPQAEIGEIVIDPADLLTATSPLTGSSSPERGSVKQRIREVSELLAQINAALDKSSETIRILERDASREIVRGMQGDRWRQAVRRLAKAVAEIAELDAAVKREADALRAQLPDPWSLKLVQFPPSPLFKFEPGDLPNVCRSFADRLAEVDRIYHE